MSGVVRSDFHCVDADTDVDGGTVYLAQIVDSGPGMDLVLSGIDRETLRGFRLGAQFTITIVPADEAGQESR